MRFLITILLLIHAGPLLALSPADDAKPAPVQAKRVAADAAKAPALSILDRYDFGQQVRLLEQDQGAAGIPAGALLGLPGAPPLSPGVPKDFKPPKDVPLPPSVQQAVRTSDTWRRSPNLASPGPDGRVMYSYGAGLATVVCAPLRVCIVELQPGEKLIGPPHIGDAVRWNISPAVYGHGDEATSVVVLKPQMAGLDTDLLITTDRRAYYIRLISKPEEYVARVAFAYPVEDNQAAWRAHLAQQRAEEMEASRRAEAVPAVIAVDRLHFDYKVTGGTAEIRPVRVFDDGSKTYIQMPSEMKNREAPAMVVVGADGKGEMVNYRVKEQTYIVDRLFDHARLLLGAGKKGQKVEISREPRS